MQLSDRFAEALIFATQLHSQQTRKGGKIPYISHLLGVASLVLENGGDEEEAIAALLHDAVEDQGGEKTRAIILEKFGLRVTEIVDGCTDTDKIPKPPWHDRKQKYIDKIYHAQPSVRLVSSADKLHNARAILRDLSLEGETTWQKFTGGKEGSLWYYQSLVKVFLETDPDSWIVQELAQVVNLISQ